MKVAPDSSGEQAAIVDAILERIDDLDWLQGFADRAHAQLVASGCYSYRAFVARVDAVAHEEYARRIDRNFVCFCRPSLPHPPMRCVPSPPRTIEEARHYALREIPTRHPLGIADFRKRHDLFARLSSSIETSQQGSSLRDELRRYCGAVAYQWAVSIWARLPLPIRTLIKGWAARLKLMHKP